MALGMLPLKRRVALELLSLVAVPPAERQCLPLELGGASCLIARRLRVVGVFLLEPHRLTRGVAIEISEPAIRRRGAPELLVGCVLDLASRGGERLLERRCPFRAEQARVFSRQARLDRQCLIGTPVEPQLMSYSLKRCSGQIVPLGPGRIARPIAERVVLVGHIVFESVPSEAPGRPIPELVFAAVRPLTECGGRPSRIGRQLIGHQVVAQPIALAHGAP